MGRGGGCRAGRDGRNLDMADAGTVTPKEVGRPAMRRFDMVVIEQDPQVGGADIVLNADGEVERRQRIAGGRRGTERFDQDGAVGGTRRVAQDADELAEVGVAGASGKDMDGTGADAVRQRQRRIHVAPRVVFGPPHRRAPAGGAHRDVQRQDGQGRVAQGGMQDGGVGALRLVVKLDRVEAGGGGRADAVAEGQVRPEKAGIRRPAVCVGAGIG